MKFTTTLFALAAAVVSVSAEGINCEGNSNCASQGGSSISEIITKVQALDQSQTFGDGTHIACGGGTGNACAFVQNYDGTITAATALTLLQGLVSHGCTNCGSNPILAGNNVGTGELTVNWVSSP